MVVFLIKKKKLIINAHFWWYNRFIHRTVVDNEILIFNPWDKNLICLYGYDTYA